MRHGCDMAALERDRRAVPPAVIEDAAHGMNASYQNRALGTCGRSARFVSRDERSGVRGRRRAGLRDDQTRLRAAEILREKGTDRTAFMRGERDRYTWVGCGSSYVLSELLAAVAVVAVSEVPEITRARRPGRSAPRESSRRTAADPVAGRPANCRPNWHVFAVLVDPARRDWVLKALRAEA
jgi:dTDP-4-amino-4,6-dideoxygalactose transaminase